MGVVAVLHDLSQAMNVSDRIVVLKDREKKNMRKDRPKKSLRKKMMKDVYEVVAALFPSKEKPVPSSSTKSAVKSHRDCLFYSLSYGI